MVMGLVSGCLWPIILTQSPSWWDTHCSAKMVASEEIWEVVGYVVSFLHFPDSSGWWWLISSVFLTRTSCCKLTHANGFYGAWSGWAVSVDELPLTAPEKNNQKVQELYKEYIKFYLKI